VSLLKVVDSVASPLAGPESFAVVPLELATLPAADREAVFAFAARVARLQRAVRGSVKAIDEATERVAHLRRALLDTPAADPRMLAELERLDQELSELEVVLEGDDLRDTRWEPRPPSVADRVGQVADSLWYSTSAPTQTQLDGYRYAGEAFAPALERLRQLVEQRLEPLESALEAAGAPWTPGRIPRWTPE
jgi:hypothetical protein